MASITSLMGSSSSTGSIYGSRNAHIISGLGSGLDTEAMIEGLVQSYQKKITGLQQDRTKVQWQQEAYQSVSDKLVEFYRNYMSFAYSSSTNLFSSSFFNNAVKTTTAGQFANLVTATGKSSSEIILNGVAQLAQAARYSTAIGNTGLDTGVSETNGKLTATGEVIQSTTNVSNLEGSLTLTYGKKEITIDLGQLELLGKNEDGTGEVDPDKLKEAIEKQLSSQVISVGQNSYFASDCVQVEIQDGTISFSDKLGAGNSVTVKGISGELKEAFQDLSEEGDSSITFKDKNMQASTAMDTMEYLTGKTVEITLDGVTKTVTLGKNLPEGESLTQENFVSQLQKQLDEAFGNRKVVVGKTEENALTFSVAEGSSLSVTSEAGEALGIGDAGLTSYLNMGKTLGELLGDKLKNLESHELKTTDHPIEETVKEVGEDGQVITKTIYKDAEGNLVDKDGYLLDENGERKKYYDLTINGKTVGSFAEDTALDKVMNAINNSEAGVTVQYSKVTNQFVFSAKETGESGRIEIVKENGKDTLGTLLFGVADPDGEYGDPDTASYSAGLDAIFQVTVNGKTMELSRSTNSVEIDGMTLNLKGTFNAAEGNPAGISSADISEKLFSEGESVTFTSETDADTVVDAVKKMVEDYNEILKTVKELYGTQPLKNSSNEEYEPLTDEDAEGMTESEIKAYEEKAKKGIVYMDSDLSSLYNSLRSVLTSNSGLLKSVGLSTEYSDGQTTLKLDETALRQALAEDPEAVKDAFTRSTENGASSNGLMAEMQRVVDNYAATTGDPKGILVEKAGSKYSPSAALDNTMLDKMNEIDDEIQKWQDKMADRVDYYTSKFTQMEVLLQQMNSQSSALAGLMGG